MSPSPKNELIPEVKELKHQNLKLLESIERRDLEVAQLRAQKVSLEDALAHEMAVNDDLLDKNIQFKGKLREIKQTMKVRVLPSSMEVLQQKLEVRANQVDTLRQALRLAITLIPENRVTRAQIAGLTRLHSEIY
jgi:hypothetical protein